MDHTISSVTPTSKKPGLLINRSFARLWTGQSLSVFGDMIFDMTLLVWVAVLTKGQPWSPLAISGLLVAAAVPNLLVGPIAGVFVDRWDKRHTMLWMDAIRAALVGLLVLTSNVVPLPFLPEGRLSLVEQLGAIFSIVLLVSVCSQFFNPSRFALIGDVVEPEHQPKAAGLTQTSQSIAMLLGPAVAPPLYLVAGVEWALLINALSFVASFVLVLSVRPPQAARSVAPGERGHFLREFREGWRFTLSNRFSSTILLSLAIVMFGASAINALDILFALQRLHAPLGLYGLLATAMGVGMLGGTILSGLFAKRIGLVRLFTLCLLLIGICILLYSRMTNFGLALPLLFFAGFFQAGLNVAFGPLLLRVTPRELIGRVKAILDPTTALVTLLGTAVVGYLAGTVLQGFHAALLGLSFGPIDTIFTASAIIVLLGAIYTISRLGFTDPQPLVPASPAPASAEAVSAEAAPEAPQEVLA
jgi:MFS family permease